jgi:parvulin-like peptidyl-prolyl isomerase
MDTEQKNPGSSLRAIIREPTLHFFLIAVAIFALYAITRDDNETLLEISQREIDARIFLQELSRGEELSAEQRQLIISVYVEEQILVQEALAMGLDNDVRIHDMLAQKMRHVLSANVIQPSAEEMEEFYRRNRLRYEIMPIVTADEVVFDTTEPLSTEVMALLENQAEPDALLAVEAGTVSVLPRVNRVDLSNIFEDEFSQNVFATSINEWVGPFASNRGQHWLRVTQKTAVRIPPLEEIIDRVRLDWIGAEEELRLQQEIDKLSERYSIVIIDDV